MGGIPTSADLGLPQHSYDELVEVVCQLPFEMSMRASAILQALLDRDARLDGATQLRLAERLMPGSWVLDRLRQWIAEPDHVIFSEQALFALQRLVVLHAPSRPGDLFDDPGIHELFLQALLATPTAVLDRVRTPTTPDQWVAYLMRTGGFYRCEPFVSLLGRYHRLWHHIAPALVDHPDSCPIHEWYATTHGRSIAEDEAFTLAVLGRSTHFLWGKSRVMLIEEGLPENPLLVSRDELLAATGLGDRAAELRQGPVLRRCVPVGGLIGCCRGMHGAWRWWSGKVLAGLRQRSPHAAARVRVHRTQAPATSGAMRPRGGRKPTTPAWCPSGATSK